MRTHCMEVLKGARKYAANERDEEQDINCTKPRRAVDIKEVETVVPE